MSKINETLNLIQSGARSNKYRILYPVFGEGLDILCHSASLPGREVGTVEVFVKGRKYQLAGEMSDAGTWEMTIYNTPDLLYRRFFLKMVGGVHNFNTPNYLIDGGEVAASDLNGGTNTSISGTTTKSSGGSLLGSISGAVSIINSAYQDMKSTYNSVKRVSDNIKNAINGDWISLETLITSTGYDNRPWYQQEVIIQQLDHDDEVIATTVLNNAFVTAVSPIEYSDETQEISTTTITFAYSGIEYGSNSEINEIEKY